MRNIIWQTGNGCIFVTNLYEDADSASVAKEMQGIGAADKDWTPVSYDVTLGAEHYANFDNLKWDGTSLVVDSSKVVSQTKTDRIAYIDAELSRIDAKGARASREVILAIAGGNVAPVSSLQKLADLESQAAPLRTERKTLTS